MGKAMAKRTKRCADGVVRVVQGACGQEGQGEGQLECLPWLVGEHQDGWVKHPSSTVLVAIPGLMTSSPSRYLVIILRKEIAKRKEKFLLNINKM